MPPRIERPPAPPVGGLPPPDDAEWDDAPAETDEAACAREISEYFALDREIRERRAVEGDSRDLRGRDRTRVRRREALAEAIEAKARQGEALTLPEKHFLLADLIDREHESSYAQLLVHQHSGEQSRENLTSDRFRWEEWLKKTAFSAGSTIAVSILTGTAVPAGIAALGVGAASLARLGIEYLRQGGDLQLRRRLARRIDFLAAKAKELATAYEADRREHEGLPDDDARAKELAKTREEALKQLFFWEVEQSKPSVLEADRVIVRTQEELKTFRTKWWWIEGAASWLAVNLGGMAGGAIFSDYQPGMAAAAQAAAARKAEWAVHALIAGNLLTDVSGIGTPPKLPSSFEPPTPSAAGSGTPSAAGGPGGPPRPGTPPRPGGVPAAPGPGSPPTGEPLLPPPPPGPERTPGDERHLPRRELVGEDLTIFGDPGKEIPNLLYQHRINLIRQLDQPLVEFDPDEKDYIARLHPELAAMHQPYIQAWVRGYDPEHKGDAVVLVSDALGRVTKEIYLTELVKMMKSAFVILGGQFWQRRGGSDRDLVWVHTAHSGKVRYQLLDGQLRHLGQPVEKPRADFLTNYQLYFQEEEAKLPETVIGSSLTTGEPVVTEWLARSRTTIIGVPKEDQQPIMKQVAIHGSAYRGESLTPEILGSAGLIPQYQVELANNQTVYLSPVYRLDEEGRIAVVAYVKQGEEWVARSYYLSNSHGVWKYLPSYAVNERGEISWYGKGISQESITAPTGLLAALAKISANPRAYLAPTEPDRIFAGTVRSVAEERAGTYRLETDARPVKLAGQFYPTPEQRRRGELLSPESLAFTETGQAPDFTKTIHTFEQHSEFQGKLTIEIIPSQDGTLQYVFCRDKENYVWIGQTENLSDIQSTGLRKEWVNGGNLMTTRWQHRDETGRYGGAPHPTKPYYLDMFANYLSKVPVIREYYRVRRISPPAGFEDIVAVPTDGGGDTEDHRPAADEGGRAASDAGRSMSGARLRERWLGEEEASAAAALEVRDLERLRTQLAAEAERLTKKLKGERREVVFRTEKLAGGRFRVSPVAALQKKSLQPKRVVIRDATAREALFAAAMTAAAAGGAPYRVKMIVEKVVVSEDRRGGERPELLVMMKADPGTVPAR